MQYAKPEPHQEGASRLKICLSDIAGAPAVSRRLRGIATSLGIPFVENDLSSFATLSLVVVDVAQGLNAEARQALALARAAGAHHVVLVAVTHRAADLAACEAISTAFDDFAGKLEFSSELVVPVGDDGLQPEGLAWDSHAALRTHLAGISADVRTSPASEPAPLSEQFSAHIACVSGQELLAGRDYRLRLPQYETTASVTAVKYRLDIDSLRRVPARSLAKGQIGVCTIATSEPLALGSEGGEAARFTLSDLFNDEVIAAGSVDFALRRGINVHWQPFTVTKELRAAAKDQRPCIVWFTGLSGAGKSTIANHVEGWLALQGRHTYLLDGDNVRHGLNKDLGFTAADRVENIRRVGEVARLFVDAGVIVLCSFISPFHAEREAVRSLVGDGEFLEIHVTAPLNVCEHRDPKGLYAKSRAGLLPNFTGIDSPYEAPEAPDLVLDTTTAPAAELAQRVVALLQMRGVVAAPEEHVTTVRGL
jgi:bifunctional enzyme CysN/CysC